MIFPTTRVFIDVETGGLDPVKNGLTEIALLAFHCQTFETYRPLTIRVLGDPAKEYNEIALKMQNRTLEDVMTVGIPKEEAFGKVFEYLNTTLGPSGKNQLNWTGKIWAHNAPFDWGFLAQLDSEVYKGNSLIFAGRPYFACSKYFMAGLRGLGLHDHPYTNLISSLNFMGDDAVETHQATDDCYSGIRLLQAFVRDYIK